jgi:hypothetical protein
MNRVAILQSSYIPWKGYFDLIHRVDNFIFLDDVQMTNRDWRNRNRIKTPQGICWLTIPVGSHKMRLIDQVEISDHAWQKKHFLSLKQHYGRAPFFREYQPWLEEIYLGRIWTRLSSFNQHLIREIACNRLSIATLFSDSRDYPTQGTKTTRLLSLLRQCGATHYLSGPGARAYLDESLFRAEGIVLEYMAYQGYPEYTQPHGAFEHHVTILDLLFNAGSDSSYYIWGWKNKGQEQP